MRGQDEEAFAAAMQDGFRYQWGFIETPLEDDLRDWRAFMENTPHFDPELFLLAMDGQHIAGTLCGIAQPGEGPHKGWIFGLCVLRPWRRRGLAQAMLLHSFGQLYARGMWCIGLGVDADSLTGATRLYEKVGMHVERRHEMWEKELPIGHRIRDAEPGLTPRCPAMLSPSLRLLAGLTLRFAPNASSSRARNRCAAVSFPNARRHSPLFQIWYDRASRRNLRG